MKHRQTILSFSILEIMLSCLLVVEGKNNQDEVLLTPYWSPVNFGEGETASIDCGYFTNGKPDDFKMSWNNKDGVPIQDIENRIKLNRETKIKVEGSKNEVNASYSVLTMTIMHLEKKDDQSYTCKVENIKTRIVKSSTITVQVLDKHNWFGFERDDMSGWNVDTSTPHSANWHKHDAHDPAIISRSKGPRYDHTYGPSKHIGHFIDVDLEHETSNNKSTFATILSPIMDGTSKAERCLHFWYILDGDEIEKLEVFINNTLTATGPNSLITITKNAKSWNHTEVDLHVTPQYQIIFQATISKDSSKKGAVALDDIAITDGTCQEAPPSLYPSNDGLKVRLVNSVNVDQSSGRVEVLHDGRYGSVCSDQFGDAEAKVICRSLGKSYVNATGNVFGPAPSNSPIWMTSLSCAGDENSLAECISKNQKWGQTGCTHQQDAAVICSDIPTVESTETQPELPAIVENKTELPLTTLQPSKSSSPTITTTPVIPSIPPSKPTKAVKTTYNPTSTTTTSSTTTPPTTTTSTTAKTVPTKMPAPVKTPTGGNDSILKSSTSKSSQTTTTKANSPITKPSSSTEQAPSKITEVPTNNTREYSQAAKIGRGVVAGIVVIILLGLLVFAVLIYKGRKRRARKSKYLNFGSASYSQEHLPTNEFHLESPLTMSSMGYTVLA